MACPARRAEGEILKHEGRATGVLDAAFRCRGTDSEYLGGLLRNWRGLLGAPPIELLLDTSQSAL